MESNSRSDILSSNLSETQSVKSSPTIRNLKQKKPNEFNS